MAKIKIIYQDFVGTKIWEHFRRSTCGKLAQCKLCKLFFVFFSIIRSAYYNYHCYSLQMCYNSKPR